MKPSDSILFPLSELDKGIADLLFETAPPSKWAAIQAINHLNKAWKIRNIDPEMAVFRAITAEEEAATALFLSLKRHGYVGAGRIKHHDHVHKNGLIPFVSAISRVLNKVRDQAPPFHLVLDRSKKPTILEIAFSIKHPLIPSDSWVSPQPPLNFSLFAGPTHVAKKKEDFSQGIKELLTAANVADMMRYLRMRANRRNQILYAGAEGCPTFKIDIEKALSAYQCNVFLILRIYLLVDPHSEKQLFVQQALDAYLRMLRLLPKDIDF